MPLKKMALASAAPMPAAPPTDQKFAASDDGKMTSVNQSLIFGPQGCDSKAIVKFAFSELKVIKTLGKGSFGLVQLVETPDGKKYALKEMNITQDAGTQKNIHKELHSCVDYQDDFVIKTLNIYSVPINKIYVLMELAGHGSAESLVKRLKQGKMNENAIGMLCIDTIRGLKYVHSTRTLHRDIKPANVLISEEGYCKLADFGVATTIVACDENQAQQTFAGSISYMAPERFKEKGTYSFASDVWSLGLTFYELLVGKFPFNANDFFSAMASIVDGPELQIKESEGFSNDCCALINGMLQKDPSKRLTCEQCLQMKFCKKYLDKEKEMRPIFAKWIKDNVK